MRAVVQRVNRAAVKADGAAAAEIGRGLMVLLGVKSGDSEGDARYIAEKIAHLRVFEDSEGKMNLSLGEAGGEVLLVSQFTLYGDCRKGRRPSFTLAAPPQEAEPLYLLVAEKLRALGLTVKTGCFGAHMEVEIFNDGPVTLLLDSAREF